MTCNNCSADLGPLADELVMQLAHTKSGGDIGCAHCYAGYRVHPEKIDANGIAAIWVTPHEPLAQQWWKNPKTEEDEL